MPVLEYSIEILQLFARHFRHFVLFFDKNPASLRVGYRRRRLTHFALKLALVELDQMNSALNIEVLDELVRLTCLVPTHRADIHDLL